MRRAAIPFALMLVPLAAFPVTGPPLTQAPPGPGDWCALQIRGDNRERHVYGAVSTECGSCPPWTHSAPFGNWGTLSLFGTPQDSYQFMGWQTTDYNCGGNMNTPEWNSCTTNSTWSTGQPWMNWPEGQWTRQYSGESVTLGRIFDWHVTTEEEGCSILDGAQYLFGTGLELYELDPWPWPGQEHIATLQFGATPVTLSCTREGCAPVTSPWFGSEANSVASAEFRWALESSWHCKDGKGC